VDDNLTVAVLNPLPMDQQASQAPAEAGGRHGS
jgi:hypothetical protein